MRTLLAITILLGLPASLLPAAEGRWVGRFSTKEAGGPPPGWRRHDFPRVARHTLYQLVRMEGRTALRAESRASASALVHPIDIDPSEFPWLEWSWKVEDVVPGSAWGRKKSDDFAARLFVLFRKKGGPFSPFTGLLRKMAGALPGHSLNYVWAAGTEQGRMAPSPYSRAVMMVAIESGRERAGQWVRERRNVLEDYREAFGRDPERVVAVALMTDTDNTGNSAVAYFGDIQFERHPSSSSRGNRTATTRLPRSKSPAFPRSIEPSPLSGPSD